jgi:hypothetical protein
MECDIPSSSGYLTKKETRRSTSSTSFETHSYEQEQIYEFFDFDWRNGAKRNAVTLHEQIEISEKATTASCRRKEITLLKVISTSSLLHFISSLAQQDQDHQSVCLCLHDINLPF